MSKQKNSKVSTVQIIISGGAIQSVSKPKGIRLEIRDYDIENIDAESDSRCKKDKDGDWYQEMIWEEKERVSEY